MDIHRDDDEHEEEQHNSSNNKQGLVQSPTNSTEGDDDDDHRLEEVPVEEEQRQEEVIVANQLHHRSHHDDHRDATSVQSSLHNEDACFASLPTAEELRRSNSKNYGGGRTKYKFISPETARWIKLGVAVAIVFACVVGVSVGVSRRNNNETVVSPTEVESFLLAYNISSRADLDLPGSPQREAVAWLAQDATRNGGLLPSPLSPEEIGPDYYHFLARYVMALNYFALGGPQWHFQLDFLKNDEHVCGWNGIVVDKWEDGSKNARRSGVFCDPETQMPLQLTLYGNNLKGSHIPTENGMLTSLLGLEIENNPNLGGALPTALCELTDLNSLYLGRNSLIGSIPSCIGEQLVNLKHLVLNNNLLEDELPDNIASLTNLEKLLIDDNLLTGEPLPIFNNLTDLKILMAHNNEFNGLLDSGDFHQHPALEWLDLSDNNFLVPVTGVPRHFFKMKSLNVLDLSKNRLSGHIPTDITTNTVLQYLSLYANDLNGGIPSELQNLQALIHLDLSDNLFHGPIRHELGNLSNLRFLYLGDNTDLFQGPIPEQLGNLTQMEDLSLRKTNRAGALPKFLADMVHLTYLDLGTNNFNGEIPSEYGTQLTNLEFLMLNTNKNITGNLPDSFSNLHNLRGIFIDGTGITGNVEETICKLPHFADQQVGFKYGMQVAHANCGGAVNPMKSCYCCECCGFGETCSIPHQMELRSGWEQDFQVLDFKIVTNGTTFLNKDYIPPVP